VVDADCRNFQCLTPCLPLGWEKLSAKFAVLRVHSSVTLPQLLPLGEDRSSNIGDPDIRVPVFLSKPFMSVPVSWYA